MALKLTTGQLQAQANVLNGYATTLQGAQSQFSGAVSDMESALQGTAGTAYQTVSSQTLTPQLSKFISALQDYAGNLTKAGASYDAANEDSTSLINNAETTEASTSKLSGW